MKTANYRWNEKVETFNYKLNKLREELNKYQSNSISEQMTNKKKTVHTSTKTKQDAKKREYPIIKNNEVLKNIYKRTNGGCALKDKNTNKIKNLSARNIPSVIPTISDNNTNLAFTSANTISTNNTTTITSSNNNNNKNKNNTNTNTNTNTNYKGTRNIHKLLKKTTNKEIVPSSSTRQTNKNIKTQKIENGALNDSVINRYLMHRSTSERCMTRRYVTRKSLTDRSTNVETKPKMLQLPTSRQATNKVTRTKTATTTSTTNCNTATTINNGSTSDIVSLGSDAQTGKNKKNIKKGQKCNEKKWIITTKHVKIDVPNVNTLNHHKKKSIEPKQKMKFLHFEGEDGSIKVYPVYADAEVGFHNITLVEDDNLSQVKKENQDDDDIKTTRRLAEWSSELVFKYLEETIDKVKIVFKNENVDTRLEKMLARITD